MRGIKKLYIGIILIIVAVLVLIWFAVGIQLSTQSQIAGLTIATYITNQEAMASQNVTGEGESYLSFGVLYYPGEIIEGGTIMDTCTMAIYNPGPGEIDLGVSWFTWSLEGYGYSGAGYYKIGKLKEEGAVLVSCEDVFGASQQVYADILGQFSEQATGIILPVPPDKFILNDVPLVVTLHVENYGDFKWEGDVDYIPARSLIQ